MGNAVLYELLLCKIHNCQRGGIHGAANADVYRSMERAIHLVDLQKEAIKKGQMPHTSKTVEELEYEAEVEVSHLISNLERAIREARKNTYSEEDVKVLDTQLGILSEKHFDREALDDAIEKTWAIVRTE